MAAMIHLLGALDPTTPETLGWRVQAAIAFIELHFARSGLRADEVAASQRISRRRLDQLMLEAIGVSITGHIWNRRLEQASADLRDPVYARRTASEIAFANGFEDPAHFTRAFKRRYGHSPLAWRNLAPETTH
jgi:AraC-like DNA-binding protein